MNNLFNSSELFIELKFREYETTEIIRSDQTEREKIKESRDIKTQKEIIKKNRNLQFYLTKLKQKYTYQLK